MPHPREFSYGVAIVRRLSYSAYPNSYISPKQSFLYQWLCGQMVNPMLNFSFHRLVYIHSTVFKKWDISGCNYLRYRRLPHSAKPLSNFDPDLWSRHRTNRKTTEWKRKWWWCRRFDQRRCFIQHNIWVCFTQDHYLGGHVSGLPGHFPFENPHCLSTTPKILYVTKKESLWELQLTTW
jgi:hypothetical protein